MIDWSYVAGFFDGEGTVRTHHRSGHCIRVTMANTNITVLKKIQEFLGYGRIYTRLRDRRQTLYTLEITRGRNVLKFLQGISPYSIVKGVAIKEALANLSKTRNKLTLVSRDEFERLYWKEKMSCNEIANLLGVHDTAIDYQLRQHGIPLRSRSDASRVAYMKKRRG